MLSRRFTNLMTEAILRPDGSRQARTSAGRPRVLLRLIESSATLQLAFI